ncbi:MAG TPA: ATP-binding protein [Thermotogaceae bacterium]|nr:ATP-binding protein [Thermotogaceae bacterium]
MLFSFEPKTNRKELFDREEEFKSLESSLKTYPIVVVTGLRRVGKSSLIRAFYNEYNYPGIFIDCRKLYTTGMGSIKTVDFLNEIEKKLRDLSKREKFNSIIRILKRINIAGATIEFEHGERNLPEIFEKLNEFAQESDNLFIIYLDEAQYMRFFGSRGGKELLALLAYSYDYLKKLRFVITGSEIGVLHDFLKHDDYDSPLYGRPLYEIVVKPFTPELSIKFLQKGFEEFNIKADFDLSEIVKIIDGIPGYLVHFGLKYVETGDKCEALKSMYHTLEGLIKNELSELSKRSERYEKVLKLIAQGINTWSQLKNWFYSKNDRISDSRLQNLLINLMKLSYISKSKEGYEIIDPVLKDLLKRM